MTLDELNQLPEPEAADALLSCCGSRRWVSRMLERRPFANFGELIHAADQAGHALTHADWLEAFAAHPRIGERSTAPWSQQEQAAALEAGQAVQQALLAANRQYEEKYGFIFIVFASGKTPEQMLQLMRERMHNSRNTEIMNAAAEQQKITRARLLKLLEL